MSTPRVSRTVVRAIRPRVGISSGRCHVASPFSTSCRNDFGARIRDGGVNNGGMLGWRVSRQLRQVRTYSQETENKSKYYTFEDMQTLTSAPHPNTHIIDVRSPLELQQTGRIPGAINISIMPNPDAFSISEEEFEDRFGFERPPKEEECVFYCKSGVRSRAAAEIAKVNGWVKVGEFEGSWGEWSAKGGEAEK